MNFSRIRSCIDVDQMQHSKVVLIGAGGSVGLACNLARCGVRVFHIYDFDMVTEENIPRQGHSFTAIGLPKTEALAAEIHRINPDAIVRCYNRDVTTMSDEEQTAAFANAHLLINGTDSFKAQSFGNEIALKFKIPAIWIGLYAGGGAGEVIFWDRDILPCYRCLCAKRYLAQEQAAAEGRSLDPSSHGCTINDITFVDSIAGDIAIGLLTRGADNRHGRLIDQFNGRNCILAQLDPMWSLNGGNPIRRRLGVPADNASYFSWNTMVLSDPDEGQLYCPDCEKYRGHIFWPCHGRTQRIVRAPEPARRATSFAAWSGGPHNG